MPIEYSLLYNHMVLLCMRYTRDATHVENSAMPGHMDADQVSSSDIAARPFISVCAIKKRVLK